MEEMISVIIPVYNVKPYLKRCISSVLNQSYQNLEIILVDDGSTDGSAKICDGYATTDSRVQVIHQENGGLSRARNTGLDAAGGGLISFVDSDDYIEPEMLKTLYQTMKMYDADMSLCSLQYIDESGWGMARHPKNLTAENECIHHLNDYWPKVYAENGMLYVVAWNKLYQKKLWKTLRYPEGKLNEDAYVLHKLISQCHKIGCTSYIGYSYVQRQGSIMAQKEKKANFDVFEAWLKRIKYFQSIQKDNFSRKQLAEISAKLSAMYFICKTPDEKKSYQNLARQCDTLYRQLYSGMPIPLKENIKRIGCLRAPGLINLVENIYAAGWMLIRNWREKGSRH